MTCNTSCIWHIEPQDLPAIFMDSVKSKSQVEFVGRIVDADLDTDSEVGFGACTEIDVFIFERVLNIAQENHTMWFVLYMRKDV